MIQKISFALRPNEVMAGGRRGDLVSSPVSRRDELSLPVPSLGPEQMLLQQLLEQHIDSAAPLRKDALNRAAPGGYPIFEDDPITTHPQPVMLLQRAFERANVAARRRARMAKLPNRQRNGQGMPAINNQLSSGLARGMNRANTARPTQSQPNQSPKRAYGVGAEDPTGTCAITETPGSAPLRVSAMKRP